MKGEYETLKWKDIEYDETYLFIYTDGWKDTKCCQIMTGRDMQDKINMYDSNVNIKTIIKFDEFVTEKLIECYGEEENYVK